MLAKMNRLFANLIKTNLRQRMFYGKHAYSEEYTVSQFCKLHIVCPFNIKIRPLDLHTFQNNDKLFIKFQGEVPTKDINFKFSQENDKVFITTNYDKPKDITCYVEAPIKSDLHITTTDHGSIDVKQFKGDNVILNSESGDIVSENCQNSTIKYISRYGNIISNGTLHAANITLETQESGCIIANHIQALKGNVKTADGDVKMDSCYCDETHIETQTGKLMLNNVHKNCLVDILDCGILQMTGFDGTLTANIKEGEADVQLTKLHDVSKISMDVKSPILIRLAETVMDNTRIKTNSSSISITESIKMNREENNNIVNFMPTSNKYQSELLIDCPTSHLVIDEASWADMFKLKGRNF